MVDELNILNRYLPLIDTVVVRTESTDAPAALTELENIEDDTIRSSVAEVFHDILIVRFVQEVEIGEMDRALEKLQHGSFDQNDQKKFTNYMNTMMRIGAYILSDFDDIDRVSVGFRKAVEDVQALSDEQRDDGYTLLKTVSDAVGRKYRPNQGPKGPQL